MGINDAVNIEIPIGKTRGEVYLDMRENHGFSMAGIAELFGITVSAVSHAIRRERERMTAAQ